MNIIEKWDKTSALGSAMVEMGARLKEHYRELAEFEAHGMEEAVDTKRKIIARAEKDLETIRAMRGAIR
ncbi:hypothetical protein MHO82_24630 [Vibrio sp. Of7-15]|uniref:hypothetical protein n=1 Tax=Vibrio sp. Of7-15 TaxID=2724879 RepID=UPI001EF340D2|nr:hypothetical protein [Vibrio sp. Of7-15]MCG7500054.1 hypothetical protein [Vibrio sp. Of7-15]